MISIHEKLDTLTEEVANIKRFIGLQPNFLPLSIIAKRYNKKPHTILARLKNRVDLFEPEIDYRKNGKFWEISQNALSKINELYS